MSKNAAPEDDIGSLHNEIAKAIKSLMNDPETKAQGLRL